MQLKLSIRSQISIVTLAVTLFGFATPEAAHAFAMYYITDLGALGDQGSRGLSINEQEQAVGVSNLVSGDARAVFWQSNQMIDLGTLGGSQSNALYVNDQGQIVGWAQLADGSQRAFVWSSGQMTDLGTFGGRSGGAWKINNAGQVVGNAETPDGLQKAFLWSNNQLINLGTLGGGTSDALGVNDSGNVVGWAATSESSWGQPFFWSNGQMTNLGILEGDQWGQGNSINNSDQIVGVSVNSANDRRAVLWQNGQKSLLPDLGGRWAEPRSINNRGQVVGWSGIPNSDREIFRAAIWEDGQVADLNSLIRPNSGWVLQEAWDINERGQIVGHGIYLPTGQRHAFALTESCRMSAEQQNPLLPDRIDSSGFHFDNVPTDLWYDPPASMGFTFETTGNSLFTHILNFPCGIDPDNTFTVSTGGTVLGSFQAGQRLDFVQLLGQGVPEFTISDINADLDPNNPKAFPLQLAFDTPTASFTMRPVPAEAVPEPSTIFGLLTFGVMGFIQRQRQQRSS